jgi:hypothetical protein
VAGGGGATWKGRNKEMAEGERYLQRNNIILPIPKVFRPGYFLSGISICKVPSFFAIIAIEL